MPDAEGKTLLIEVVFDALSQQDLVSSAEEFSTDWCNKSRSWYAERKHSSRDFSATAAISCLDTVNRKRLVFAMREKRMGGLLAAEIQALDYVQGALNAFLYEKHRIAEVALSTASGAITQFP